jgi:tryptophanyl-tRNA synthetase
MSKSYENAIYLSDSAEIVDKKIRPMKTDVRRKRRTDPGVPDDCPVFSFHKSFSSEDERTEVVEGCTTASIGCIDCKKILINNLNTFMDPIRERREKFEKLETGEILAKGNTKARERVGKTVADVRKRMKV